MLVSGSSRQRERTRGQAPVTTGGLPGARDNISEPSPRRSERIILGLDEVGRGPWAGPLAIAAVTLPHPYPAWVEELTDSKKLTKKNRERLAKVIMEEAPAVGIGWVSARELDATGLADSLKLAARRAVAAAREQGASFTEIVIDGTVNFLAGTTLENHVTTLKKADFLVKEVSAASIVAKVARDEYMTNLAAVYPGYGFENHVGYGTAAHRSALIDLGPTPEHRSSFKPVARLSRLDDPEAIAKKKNTTALGARAEAVVARFLEENGHEIITRNHKTKFYEIDIISKKDDNIYFTEVKYRKNPAHGSPLSAITKEKQKQMSYAAESFLKFTQTNLKPTLAAASVSGPDFTLDDWFPLSA